MPLLSDWLSEISVAKAQSAFRDAGDFALSLRVTLYDENRLLQDCAVFSASSIAICMIVFVAVIYCILGAGAKWVAKLSSLRRLCDVRSTAQGS